MQEAQALNYPSQDVEVKSQTFNLEIKQTNIDNSDPQWLYFKAYAAVFGNVDYGNDKIEKGALQFDEVNLLYNHNWDAPIGKLIRITEDDFGIFIEGKISKTQNTDNTKIVLDGIMNGYITDVSIGYIAQEVAFERQEGLEKSNNMIRLIKQAQIIEVSIVNKGMNKLAKILDFKSYDSDEVKDVRSLEKYLKDIGLSSSKAKTLISICKNAITGDIESKFQLTRDEELKKTYNQGKRDAELNIIINQLKSISNKIKK